MFSSAVKLLELNDFLNPAQECIKQLLESAETAPPPPTAEEGDVQKLHLYDCLACSACVTSDEARLVEEHSNKLLLRAMISRLEKLDKNENFREQIQKQATDLGKNLLNTKSLIISISSQSLFALTEGYGYKFQENFMVDLSRFLHARGVDFIFDTSIADLLYESECVREAQIKLKLKAMPIISGHCPGWVCYAEKSSTSTSTSTSTPSATELGELMSKVPSSQVIQGILLKTLFVNKFNKNAFIKPFNYFSFLMHRQVELINKPIDEIFHVSIQPCFDKKLEATREKIKPYIDLVLATSELFTLLNDLGFNPHHQKNEAADGDETYRSNNKLMQHYKLGGYLGYTGKKSTSTCLDRRGEQTQPGWEKSRDNDVNQKRGGGGGAPSSSTYNPPQLYDSGGQLGAIVEASSISRGIHNKKFGRNKDHEIFNDGQFSRQTGLRNIKNFIQQISKQPQKFTDLIATEILACPGGCLNGAGQQLYKKDSHHNTTGGHQGEPPELADDETTEGALNRYHHNRYFRNNYYSKKSHDVDDVYDNDFDDDFNDVEKCSQDLYNYFGGKNILYGFF